jgi:hypothetical protein
MRVGSFRLSTDHWPAYLLLLPVLVGILARLKGIGQWPLAEDEYFTMKSVSHILASGLPRFEFGGYYARGLLYQYLEAFVLLFGGRPEAVARIVTVVINLLALPALYLLGLKLSGRLAAVAAVILFSLSLWEIEFSRFIRMYAPFQTLFVWYLLFLSRAMESDDPRWQRALYLVSFASVFVHEAGILLLLMNAVPWLVRRQWPSVASAGTLLLLIILARAFQKVNFRRLGVTDYLPSDLPQTGLAGATEPGRFLFETVRFDSLWAVTLIAACLATAWAVGRIARSRTIEAPEKAVGVGLLGLSLAGLAGMWLLLAVVALLLGWLRPGTRRAVGSDYRLVAGVSALNWLLWTAYAFGSASAPELSGAPAWKPLVVMLLKYPDVFEMILYPWLRAVPALTIVSGLVIAAGTWAAMRRPEAGEKLFLALLAVLICLCGLVGLDSYGRFETRYTFFLYPLVLVLVSDSLVRLGRLASRVPARAIAVSSIMLAGYMGVVEDFGVAHLLNIDSKEVNFRLVYDDEKVSHYYPREDIRSPALVVNRDKRAGDLTVSMVEGTDYYLNGLDYFYRDYQNEQFSGTAAKAGTKELWSGANLLYRESMLSTLLGNHESTVWVIKRVKRHDEWRNERDLRIEREYGACQYYESIDRAIVVYRIPVNKAECSAYATQRVASMPHVNGKRD